MLQPPCFEWRYPQTILQFFRQLEASGYLLETMRSVREAYDLATGLFSCRFTTPGGKPLLSHCVGTAGILASLEAPSHLLTAALLHNAYQVGDFGDGAQGPTAARRREMREAVGEAAEAVVARFAELRLRPDAAARKLNQLSDLDQLERETLLVWAADHLEHHLDLGVLLCAKGARDEFPLWKREVAIDIAIGLGFPRLADELRRVHAEIDSASVSGCTRSRTGEYFVLPRSYHPTMRILLRHLARRLLP